MLMLGSQNSFGAIKLASIIGDNMVLQQQTDAALWGKATPGSVVEVSASWGGQVVRTQADSLSGKWLVRIPTPQAGGPYTISFSEIDESVRSGEGKKVKRSSDKGTETLAEKIVIGNVMVGEVWLCSGQSNMYMRMRGYASSPVEGAAEAVMGARASVPVRIFDVPERMSYTPMEDVEARWEENTPEVVGRSSALAWFFASYLQSSLDVPVGVISSAMGGSSIEAWLDRKTVEEKFGTEFDLTFLDEGKERLRVHHPTCVYNAHVEALIPYTFKGMLWYQGESNREMPEQYIRLQTTFVEMMRSKFQNPSAPFYYAQISPFHYDDPDGWTNGYFYEAQAKCLETIPNSHMIVTADLGMYDNIHPVDKRSVALRMAWQALQYEYGVHAIDVESPVYESMTIEGNKIRILFKTSNTVGPRGVNLEGFEVAGEDRVFHKASARATWGEYVDIVCDEVEHPVAVRYAFRNWSKADVKNNWGIPAAPFRTDDW